MPPSRSSRPARVHADRGGIAPRPPTLRDELGKRGPFASAEQEVFLNLLRTATLLDGGLTALFKPHGLSGSTYNALRILRGHHPHGVPSQTIGAQLVARGPDVTRLVDRLVKLGLAERERTSRAAETDRRKVIVHVTPKGLALLSELDEPVLRLHKRQLGHMTKPDLALLIDLLTQARCGVACTGEG